MYMFLLLL